VSKQSNQQEKSLLSQAWRALFPYIRRVLVFSIFTSLLVLTPSVYMLEVYGRVLASRNYSTLLMLTVLVIGAYVMLEMLEWVRKQIMHQAGNDLDKTIRNPLIHAMFAAQLGNMKAGSNQALQDLKTLRDFLSSQAFLSFIDVPLALFVLVLIFIINPVLGWFAVAGALVLSLIGLLNGRRVREPFEKAQNGSIAARVYAGGVIRNAQVIESMGMLEHIYSRWQQRQQEFVKQQAVASEYAGANAALSKMVQTMLGSLILGMGAWFAIRGELSASLMIVASILGGRLLAPLVLLIGSWKQVEDVRECIVRLDRLLTAFPEPEAKMPLPAPKGLLTVEGVVAKAPEGQTQILKGVSFGVAPGGSLAIVGPSASGKTTLARLLVGIWPAAIGAVRLDGSDIYGWDKEALGPYVGYLPQNVELFDGTFAENIARFGDVDDEAVRKACRMVGLDAFIESLPASYNKQIGDDGAFLSGGQRQRVALARAVYGMPKFVVLDEPNSSLDEAGDAALVDTLRRLKENGTTVIVITHRKNILTGIDYMLVLFDGRIQKIGKSKEVLAHMQSEAMGRSPDGQSSKQPEEVQHEA